MSLQEKLDAFRNNFQSGGPPYNAPGEVVEIMHRATSELKTSGIMDRVLKVGDHAPDFILPDYQGALFDSAEARTKGPLVVSFYRGVW